MKFNSIQIIALILVGITFIKLSFMVFRKNSFNSFFESYKSSVSKKPWVYFNLYFFSSIIILYFIKTNTDVPYTEIVAITMFVSFLINAGIMGTNLIEHYDWSKINWKMMTPYILVWIFLMFKSLQEIFNF